MTNAGNKKLLALLVTLVLLAAGLIAMGSTFATQLKLDGTSGTLLQDKNFSVNVKYHDGTGYNSDLYADTAVFTDAVLWCPNKTEIVYLKLTNQEKFPVQCTLNLFMDDNMLNDVMQYAVVGQLLPDSEEHPSNWYEFHTAAEMGCSSLNQGINEAFSCVLPDNTPVYYAVALHMDENASSAYQNQQLGMTFQLRIDANYEPGATPAN